MVYQDLLGSLFAFPSPCNSTWNLLYIPSYHFCMPREAVLNLLFNADRNGLLLRAILTRWSICLPLTRMMRTPARR